MKKLNLQEALPNTYSRVKLPPLVEKWLVKMEETLSKVNLDYKKKVVIADRLIEALKLDPIKFSQMSNLIRKDLAQQEKELESNVKD